MEVMVFSLLFVSEVSGLLFQAQLRRSGALPALAPRASSPSEVWGAGASLSSTSALVLQVPEPGPGCLRVPTPSQPQQPGENQADWGDLQNTDMLQVFGEACNVSFRACNGAVDTDFRSGSSWLAALVVEVPGGTATTEPQPAVLLPRGVPREVTGPRGRLLPSRSRSTASGGMLCSTAGLPQDFSPPEVSLPELHGRFRWERL